MQEPIGVTQIIPPTADAMPVRNDPASDNDAFVVDAPYLLSDGKSREAPIPVVVVDADMWVDRAGNLRDVARFNISGLIPTLTVTGGVITPFNRIGVDYIEVLWQASGGFTLTSNITGRYALSAGGANGGKPIDTAYVPAGGGAGGLVESIAGAALAMGSYSINIGLGAAKNTIAGGGTNGFASSIITPSGALTAVGGGRGAGDGTRNFSGTNGGSGGGARGGTINGAIVNFGTGTSGQGFSGGQGIGSVSVPGERASGGGGGAGGVGGNASPGVAGSSGAGRYLDWIAVPRTVNIGGDGMVFGTTGSSSDATWGGGSRGSIDGTVGAGGPGFMFLVVRAADVNVVMA